MPGTKVRVRRKKGANRVSHYATTHVELKFPADKDEFDVPAKLVQDVCNHCGMEVVAADGKQYVAEVKGVDVAEDVEVVDAEVPEEEEEIKPVMEEMFPSS
jgi:hypothetical protein